MSYPRPTKDILRDLDEASATGRGLVSPSPDFAAGRLAGLREAAEVIAKFGEAALKCDRCGDIRNTYIPGGCKGEARYRESDEFKTAVALDGAYSAVRHFEKHLCRPREMERDEIMRELTASILALAEGKEG